MTEPVENAVDAEARGVVLALRVLGVGEGGLAYVAGEQQSLCRKLWHELENSDLARLGSEGTPEIAGALPIGIEGLHPTWIADALAGEPEYIVEIVRAALPEALAAALPESRKAALLPCPVCAEVVRLAFAEVAPLCARDGGPLAQRLSRTSFGELLDEVTRLGARTVGRSLTTATPAARARAMAAVGEPWAKEILSAAEEPSPDATKVASALLAEAMLLPPPRTPIERLQHLGILALRSDLRAEHSDSICVVAGRLPVDLGRLLLGG